jgi:alkylation response protein AidB-like acyl-CoA dehydrogenase
MDVMYRLTPEQAAIVAQAREIADRAIAPHAAQVDAEESFPHDSFAALGEAGFLGLTVPTEHGGMGQGVRVACAVLDELAQRCPSTAMIYMMHLAGIACYTAAPERTAPLLQAAAEGGHLSTLAWSERGSGSYFWVPVSREVRENGNVRLNAEKSFVTAAGVADGYVVSTGWSGATEPTQSMLYLVLRSDEGFSVAGRWQGMALRGNASAPMRLENVVIGADRALSPDGRGLDVMLGVVLPVFQLSNAAVCVGIAEAAVQATRSHLMSKKLEHLGAQLADLPRARARLAEMRIETDRARAHLTATIDAVEHPSPATQLLVLEAKAAANEAVIRVTDLAMRTCGGSALHRGLGIERLFRDARAPIVMAPTSDQTLEFIGRALCGMEVLG